MQPGGQEGTGRLVEEIANLDSRLLVVVTGAGISVASGIPVFRGEDRDAIWNRSPMELATRAFFERDPVTQWRWYLSRFDSVLGARPNEAHTALAELERWHRVRGGEFLLVTQNIDTLHERAGSEAMIKVHGTADRVRCSGSRCENAAPCGSIAGDSVDLGAFRAEPSRATLPACPACGAMLRPHVLFFDEFYAEHRDYAFDRAIDAADRMSLVLFVGTSFSVGVTEHFTMHAALRGVPSWSIDPSPVREPRVAAIARRSEEALPEIARRLAASAGA